MGPMNTHPADCPVLRGGIGVDRPGERIEPRVLRLFRQVMSRRIEGLKVHWKSNGHTMDQAPGKPVFIMGETMSLFAGSTGKTLTHLRR